MTVPLLVICAVVSVSVSTYLYALKEVEYHKRISVERSLASFHKTEMILVHNLNRAKELQRKLEQKLGEAVSIKRDLLAKLREKDDIADTLKNTLIQREEQLELSTTTLREMELKIRELSSQLGQERLAIGQLSDELTDIKTRFGLAVDRNKILEKKIGELKSEASDTVELAKIVVKSMPRLSGKIISVNEDFGFVVIDLGRQDALDVGTIFSVYRQEDLIGKVQIEEVRDQISAATVLPGWANSQIKINDVVEEL